MANLRKTTFKDKQLSEFQTNIDKKFRELEKVFTDNGVNLSETIQKVSEQATGHKHASFNLGVAVSYTPKTSNPIEVSVTMIFFSTGTVTLQRNGITVRSFSIQNDYSFPCTFFYYDDANDGSTVTYTVKSTYPSTTSQRYILIKEL